MASKANKKQAEKRKRSSKFDVKANFEGAGSIFAQNISETIETNFMPYAMSVIVSRAIPEIDGFKPAHRKLLYTMYKMNLLQGARTKSANVVGQTMKLNPHGDGAIYETMVRMSRGNEALLHPYVDSKGNFGKAYSRDMAYAASRYTEVKLAAICAELFKDIDKDSVDFVDNYDATMQEPTLLPARYPSVLVNSNMGLAVGMATQICPFNLEEVCETTIGLLKNKDFDVCSTLKAPDFPGGGFLIYEESALKSIYETGRGSFKIRAKYNFDKEVGCIEITEIPPSTTIEAIIDKIAEHIKNAKIREISDVRDETDLSGLKITIDLKRGTDSDKLMQKLYKMTPLQDNFSCNFNILIQGTPRVMGVKEILNEWIAFRLECVKRRIYYDLAKKKEKLHLLQGLSKILLDIDKAIKIVRETDEETEVVPNLMIGFGIDRIQAEYVAEIKLRHLNREYILKRTAEIEELLKEIAEMEEILKSTTKQSAIIVSELKEIVKKHGMPRKTMLIRIDEEDEAENLEEEVPDYPVNFFFTKEGYFKKITPQSYRMSNVQKLKEDDEVIQQFELSNGYDLLFFSDKGQVYKARARDFEDTKASALGDFIPARLGFDSGESAIFMVATKDYSGFMMFFFENGKVAKVPISSYETKTNRKKLSGAYSDASPIVSIKALQLMNTEKEKTTDNDENIQTTEDNIDIEKEFLMTSSGGKALIVHSGAIPAKVTRSSQGVNVMTLKKGAVIISCEEYIDGKLEKQHLYRTKNLPAVGKAPVFSEEQISF